jgi:hypothetical protein
MREVGEWELGFGGEVGGYSGGYKWIPLRSFLPPQTESLQMKPAVVASERANRVERTGLGSRTKSRYVYRNGHDVCGTSRQV